VKVLPTVNHSHLHQKDSKSSNNKIMNFFDDHYKKLLLIPTILLLLSIIVIGMYAVNTGEFLSKGVSLKGGIELEIASEVEMTAIEFQNKLESSLPTADIQVTVLSRLGAPTGYVVIASDVTTDQLFDAVSAELGDITGNYSKKETESSLGASFFKETLIALLFAFIFMGAVVFIYFRTFAPSLAVILSALSDIIITVAVVDLMGIKVSAAGIAAFLMLIGYSVDTDIMLSAKVIKSADGTVTERIFNALKTGLTMTGTTLTAIIVVLLFSQSVVLSQIMSILLIGLIIDIMNTWLQNAAILKWYSEKYPNKVGKVE